MDLPQCVCVVESIPADHRDAVRKRYRHQCLRPRESAVRDGCYRHAGHSLRHRNAGIFAFIFFQFRMVRPDVENHCSLVRLHLLCREAGGRIQFHIFGGVKLSIDISDRNLADEFSVKLRCRPEVEAEIAVHRHRNIDISFVLPLRIGGHPPAVIPYRRKRVAADIDDRLIAGDIDGSLAAQPGAPGSRSDILDHRLPLSVPAPHGNRHLLIRAQVKVRELMPRRQNRPDRLVYALLTVVRHLHAGPGCRGFLQVRSRRHEQRVPRNVQNIVFVRADPHIAGRDLIAAVSVSEKDRVVDLRRVLSLLLRELKSHFLRFRRRPVSGGCSLSGVCIVPAAGLRAFSDLRQCPVRIAAGLPIICIRLHKFPVGIGEHLILRVKLLCHIVEIRVVAGQVNGDSAGPLHIGRAPHHHFIHRLQAFFALLREDFPDLARKIPQVDQVAGILSGVRRAQSESLGPASRLIERSVLPAADPLSHRVKQIVRRFDHIPGSGQVQRRQRHIRVKKLRPVLFIILPIRIHDPADDFRGIVRLIQPSQKCIVPSPPGLQFLRPHQEIGVAAPQLRVLQRSHKTGIKADPVQFPAASAPGSIGRFIVTRSAVCVLARSAVSKDGPVHGAAQFFQQKAVIFEEFIAPVSPERTAAVIPQDQAVVLRRIVFRTVIDKLRERPGRPHIRADFSPRDDPVRILRGHIQHIVARAGNIAHPAPAAARIHKKIRLLKVQPCLFHFRHIVGGGPVAALQIGSHYVDHHGVVFDRAPWRRGAV